MISASMLAAASDDDQQRAQEIAHRWELYEKGPAKPLKIENFRNGQVIDDNVVPNYCATIVDAGVSFLFGGDVEFALDLDDDEESPVEDDLDDFWRLKGPNGTTGKLSFLQRLALTGGVAGHAFVRLIDRRTLGLPPRPVILDPAYLTIFTDEDDHELIVGFKVQYGTVRGGTGAVVKRLLIVPDDPKNPASWSESLTESYNDGKDWHAVDETPWPYPFPPIVMCQNLPNPHEVWGRSDLDGDIEAMNGAVAGILSNARKTVRHYGHPTTFLEGCTPDQVRRLSIAIGDAVTLPSGARASNLEMAGSLESVATVYRLVKDALHERARVPEVATGKVDNIGQLSGLAISLLYGPLVEKTMTKRGTYGDLLAEVSRRALFLMGHTDDDLVVHVQWPQILPKSDLEEAQTAQILDGLGVSKETLIENLGFDPATEEKRRQDEAAEALANGQAALGDDLSQQPPTPGQQPPAGQQPPTPAKAA